MRSVTKNFYIHFLCRYFRLVFTFAKYATHINKKLTIINTYMYMTKTCTPTFNKILIALSLKIINMYLYIIFTKTSFN